VSENLVELAQRFVRLSGELDAARDAMKRLLLKGAGEPPKAPFVSARSKPGASHPAAIAAGNAEREIMELLKVRPMGATAIAKAMDSKVNTTAQRLARMRERGLVAPAHGGGWEATAAP
jgi:hypothetical protein